MMGVGVILRLFLNSCYLKEWDAMDKTIDVDIVAVIRCKDCDLWNAWDKHGNLCSCAHFTQDDAAPVYTKPDDFCSYAEKK
nr:MAG TPA: hypothetical protein [Caudoviricetes sp.]